MYSRQGLRLIFDPVKSTPSEHAHAHVLPETRRRVYAVDTTTLYEHKVNSFFFFFNNFFTAVVFTHMARNNRDGIIEISNIRVKTFRETFRFRSSS